MQLAGTGSMDSMDQVGQTKWSELGNLTRLDRPNGWSGNIKGNFLHQVRNLASPRVIKTHLSIDMLPEQVLLRKQKNISSFRIMSFPKLNHII